MIKHSFILLDRVGARTEQQLWHDGITTWNTFLDTPTIRGVSTTRKQHHDTDLLRIKDALWNDNYQAIIKRMPAGEQWRLYDLLHDHACYLDIETTGYYGDITVIGVYDGENSHFFVKGSNLNRDDFITLMRRFQLIITFNGSSFDIPIIERYFNVRIPHVHIDLRHVCARLGYTGGLKAIEAQLGMTRSEAAQGITGADAVHLWNQWITTREPHHLHTLLAYNEEDIINLEPLARKFIKELWEKTFVPANNPPVRHSVHA